MAHGSTDGEGDLCGDLRDADVAALCTMVHQGRKSGVLTLRRAQDMGHVYFDNGAIIDADAQTSGQKGEHALYALLRWQEGSFVLRLGAPERPATLHKPTQALLLEGMRRLDDWRRWQQKLPPLDAVLHRLPRAAQQRLCPKDAWAVLRLVDGERTLAQLLEAAPLGDVEAAEATVWLLSQGHVARGYTRPT